MAVTPYKVSEAASAGGITNSECLSNRVRRCSALLSAEVPKPAEDFVMNAGVYSLHL